MGGREGRRVEWWSRKHERVRANSAALPAGRGDRATFDASTLLATLAVVRARRCRLAFK